MTRTQTEALWGYGDRDGGLGEPLPEVHICSSLPTSDWPH